MALSRKRISEDIHSSTGCRLVLRCSSSWVALKRCLFEQDALLRRYLPVKHSTSHVMHVTNEYLDGFAPTRWTQLHH